MRKRPGGQLAARPLHFIFIADCSGSMKDDGKITALNEAIREAIPHMQRVADENPNAQVLLRAVKFSTGAQWHISKPIPIADFRWTDLGTFGRTDMGKALTLVTDQLRIPPMTDRALPPVLVLISDGQPTDDFDGALQELMEQPWGKKAVRIAIAIGEDADIDVLQRFIGHDRLQPLRANSPEGLIKYIKWASTAVLKSVSAPSKPGEENGDNGHVPLPAPDLSPAGEEDDIWGEAVAAVAAEASAPEAPAAPEKATPSVTAPAPPPARSRSRTANRPLPPPRLKPVEFETVTVDEAGQIKVRRTGQVDCYSELVGRDLSIDMVSIPRGTFTMGSPAAEPDRLDAEGPPHKVTIEPFYLARYPVTQAQWRAVTEMPIIDRRLDPEPSHFKGDDLPVESVVWQDVLEFCARLAQRTGRNYRLPTEAEWEYACRAGTTTPFHFGQTITTDLANFDGDYPYAGATPGIYRATTTPVGSFKVANAYGLYDMHGNVFEWCADPWHDNYQGAPVNGDNWEMDGIETRRVVRGGSWGRAVACGRRSACRVELVMKGDIWYAMCVYMGLRLACS